MIRVFPADPIGQDDRGWTSAFDNPGRSGQNLVSFRRPGSSSGRHYHKGLSPAKNPEVLILVSGSLRMNLRDTRSGEISTMEISGPAKIEIPPFIWHEVIALTEIYFIELNSLEDGNNDTFM
jgi:dTDP-4-dehydrorhamnose 3,5-epimerase-like enzyme